MKAELTEELEVRYLQQKLSGWMQMLQWQESTPLLVSVL